MRQTKSPAEIAKIRRAVAGTVAGHFDALRAARAGLYEYHVAAIVELRCRENGSLRQAYPSIVGSGPWSCILHYDRNTRRMEDGDVVVLDAGGAFEGYASDVTRTFPVSGRFTEEQAKVYDAVLDAQERAIAAVRPGQTLRQVHEVARSALAERGLDKWFIHGTCHSVGLDVHDPWPKDAVLRPGAVITVEPGVYDSARNLGVRIEDTVLVTEKGCEVLSSALPKKREDVERLMREDPPAGLPR
jgi:Xaa-Pro aminopeptidase